MVVSAKVLKTFACCQLSWDTVVTFRSNYYACKISQEWHSFCTADISVDASPTRETYKAVSPLSKLTNAIKLNSTPMFSHTDDKISSNDSRHAQETPRFFVEGGLVIEFL